jgi:addiction module HigA family antidote
MEETMPMKNPPHPGHLIKVEILEANGLNVTTGAAALRVTRPALSAVLNGRASLTPEMALRIEKAFGVKMDTLIGMQHAYDIVQARKHEKDIKVPRYHAPAESRV